MTTATFRLGPMALMALGTPTSGSFFGSGADESSAPDAFSEVFPKPWENRLESAFAETFDDEWLEEGRARGNQSSKIYASNFLAALNERDTPTDIYFDRNGEVRLEWSGGAGRAAVVRIRSDGSLLYASNRLGRRAHGSIGEALPYPEVLFAIRGVIR